MTIPLLPADSPLAQVTIAFLSDVHLRDYWPGGADDMIERVGAMQCDMVLNTGDLVEDRENPWSALPLARRRIERLPSRHGMFAITGNHDQYHLAHELADLNVTWLMNDRRVIDVGGQAIELIGLAGPSRQDNDPAWTAALPRPDPGTPRIVLSHFPDAIRDIGTLDADLFLAGHTHGGQVCLPGGGVLITHDSLPGRMSKGVHTVGRTTLIVNRGFGFSSRLPLRVLCPPEIIELCLTRGG